MTVSRGAQPGPWADRPAGRSSARRDPALQAWPHPSSSGDRIRWQLLEIEGPGPEPLPQAQGHLGVPAVPHSSMAPLGGHTASAFPLPFPQPGDPGLQVLAKMSQQGHQPPTTRSLNHSAACCPTGLSPAGLTRETPAGLTSVQAWALCQV